MRLIIIFSIMTLIFSGCHNNDAKDDAYNEYIIRQKVAEEKIDDVNELIRSYPNDPVVYYLRGDLYAEIDDNESSLKDFNKAIALDPNFAAAYYKRSYCYENDFSKAKSDLDKAKSLGYPVEDWDYQFLENWNQGLVSTSNK